MKTITSVIALSFFLLCSSLNAQTLTEDQRCGTVKMQQQLQQKYPNQTMSNPQFEAWIAKEIQKRKDNKQGNVLFTIPIIFHIVHDGVPAGTGINIAQQYVDAQIEQLNNDFRKVAGTSGSNNNPVGADTEIEFCAAELDPNGVQLVEPGINRIDGPANGFGNPPYVNNDWENTIKPATQWDPLSYFNVWVSDLSSGLLGYAQFPDGSGLPGMPGGGAANTDGCVVLYSSVGSSTLPYPGGGAYNWGRTLTHEAGHWLGLRHVWGDGGCGVDDFCNDTPESDASNFGCPAGHTSCGTVDQIENYMDYTDDACMNIFTIDQKARMQTVMAVSPRRMELANSNACNPNCQAAVTTNITNSNCGGPTGSISINITNGTPPYTFQWDAAAGGQTSSTAVNLPPGTYSATVTDAIGCLKFITETVLNFGPIVTVNLNAGASCFNSSDGALVVVATSGAPPYTYNWSNGNTTTSPFFLAPGVYIVTVTDSNGCIVTADGTVISPPQINPNGTSTPENCAAKDGTATVSPTGGSGSGYTYMWDPAAGGQTTATAGGLTIGSYSVTITDSDGCSEVAIVQVNGANGPTLSTSSMQAGCNMSNGSATVTPSGAGPFVYQWDAAAGNQNTPTANNLPAGTYSVIVTNGSNGCSTLANVTVTENCTGGCNISLSTNNIIHETCNGSCDGSATVGVNGGTPPFTFMWSDGQTSQTGINLCDGSYSVSVLDVNGCFQSINLIINSGPTVSAASNTTNTTCAGNDGTATIIPTNGLPPFTYLWSPSAGNQTTGTAVNLPPGMHTVTFTDNNGCSASLTVTIANGCNCTLSVFMSSTQTTCAGNDGTATVTPNGGTMPYTYLWSPSASNQTTVTAINLPLGTHTVTVSDSNGCVQTASVVITDGCNCNLTATTTTSSTTCAGNDGSASVVPNGGSLPFTFLWSPSAGNQATPIANNLPVGPHTVTVTDGNGCVVTALAVVANGCNCNITVTTATTAATCAGNDGTATATPVGGSMPYLFLWSTSASNQTTQTAINLPPGMHSVTIADATGCLEVATVTIVDACNCNLTASTTTTSTTCAGNDGTATATPGGGAGPFVYQWGATTSNQTTQTAINLPVGIHSVTITDANSCSVVATATVSDGCNCNLTVSTSTTSTTCAGNDGTATATPGGGAGPFTYLWSASAANQTTQTAINLPIGAHSVTVTDANSCVQITNVSITDGCNCSLTITATTTAATCAGNDGTATVTPTGGANPITYQWGATAGNQTTQTAINLPIGIHIVTVTDANSCTQIINVTVADGCNCNLTATASATPVSCVGNDGTATATPNGGAGPFTYLWDASAANQTTQTAINLTPGNYVATITDANGCTTQVTAQVNNTCNCNVTAVIGTTNATCGTATGSATANTAGGQPPFTFLWSTGGVTQTINNVLPGLITVTVTDAVGCTQVANATVGDAGTLNAAAVPTNLTCNGDMSGAATVTNPGALTYLWNTGAMTASINNLPAGVYTVTVSQGSCIDVVSVTVNEPAVLTGVLQANNNQCTVNGASASAVVNGGTIPYTYLWNTGGVSSTIGGLPSGNYTCTVTDSNGCSTVVTGSVTSVDNGPVLNPSLTNVSCNGANDGIISIMVNNGTAPFTYDWGNGINVPSISGLAPGSYTVQVTDANNCIAFTTVIVSQPDSMTLTAFSTPASSNNDDGTASVNVAGGVPPYTYQWNNGQTTQIATGLAEGTYSVLVVDANGCTIQGTVIVQMNTSTLDIDNLETFELFPNPSTGIFSINIEFLTDEDASLQIYNVIGQQLLEKPLSGRTFTLPMDMSEHASGIYVAKLKTTNGEAAIRFILAE